MIVLKRAEYKDIKHAEERRNDKIRKLKEKTRLADGRKIRMLENIWQSWRNEVEYLEEYPQKRTLEKMTVEEIYNDAYAMIHRTAEAEDALTVRSATAGPVDACIVRHLDALDAAKETEKVAHLYDLLEKMKRYELDPAEVEKYSDYPKYILKG